MNSPLLQLPPEIRIRIYGYVLGGRIIHLLLPPGPYACSLLRHHVCQLEASKDDNYLVCRRKSPQHSQLDDPNIPTEYIERHTAAGCAFDSAVGESALLSLALLRTSRQIHKEAALIPFLQNTFTGFQGQAFMAFSNALFLIQKRAVRHIIVLDHDALPCAASINKPLNLASVEFHGLAYDSYDASLVCSYVAARFHGLHLKRVALRFTITDYAEDWELERVETRVREVESKLTGNTEGSGL